MFDKLPVAFSKTYSMEILGVIFKPKPADTPYKVL